MWGWEIPAGGTDGEAPLLAAKRELHEETGIIAKHWENFETINISPGLTNNVTHIFTAKNLIQTDENEQEEEGIVDCKKFTIDQIKDMIKSGDIHDAPTIAALARIFWV